MYVDQDILPLTLLEKESRLVNCVVLPSAVYVDQDILPLTLLEKESRLANCVVLPQCSVCGPGYSTSNSTREGIQVS